MESGNAVLLVHWQLSLSTQGDSPTHLATAFLAAGKTNMLLRKTFVCVIISLSFLLSSEAKDDGEKKKAKTIRPSSGN